MSRVKAYININRPGISNYNEKNCNIKKWTHTKENVGIFYSIYFLPSTIDP